MNRTLSACPAGHQERLPYRGEVQSWCDRCAAMVQFTPVPPPLELPPAEKRELEATLADRCRKFVREHRPHHTPYAH